MANFGGLGGFTGGRNLNTDDLFEMTLHELFSERIKDDEFCKQLWSSLANVSWHHDNGDDAVYSFRAAGDLIAAIRGEGDYMDWYCSGPYATVSDEIEDALLLKGWIFTCD